MIEIWQIYGKLDIDLYRTNFFPNFYTPQNGVNLGFIL